MRIPLPWRSLWILLMFLYACSANRKSRINPPSQAMDIPFESHRFHADSGTTIRLATGTEIRIAPNSLVDSKGNPAQGMVDFRVREFHRTEDIFRAGIPLNTRAEGNQQLQSAGMLEMRAYSEKEELSVASGRSIGVGLASYRDAKGYDLWHMQENTDWNIRGNFRTDSNRIKWQTIRALNDSLKERPANTNEVARIFELLGNVEEAPYLRSYQNMKWRLDDSEPIERLLTDNRVNWGSVRIVLVDKKKDLYSLTFSQFDREDLSANKGIQRTILASPLTSRKEMKKRTKEYEAGLVELERKRKERLEQLASSQKEADLLQFFSADRLGIWNIDRLLKMENCIPVIVQFDFEKELPSKEKKFTIIALYDGENSVMSFKRDDNPSSIYLQKGKDMRLIALLPKEQVALVDNASIQQALQSGSKEIKFKTKQMGLRDFLLPKP